MHIKFVDPTYKLDQQVTVHSYLNNNIKIHNYNYWVEEFQWEFQFVGGVIGSIACWKFSFWRDQKRS